MKISIITVFPELYETFLKTSILARAIENKFIEFNCVRFSDMVEPKQRIDEPTCGPGVGMIIKPEVVEKAIAVCEDKWGDGYKIFFSPQGQTLDQNLLEQFAQIIKRTDTSHESKFTCLSKLGEKPIVVSDCEAIVSNHTIESKNKIKKLSKHLILVCTRYEGLDERVEQEFADLMLSIGDYVLMGGDIPAQVFIEGLVRLLPGVVGKQESIEHESFSGPFLDFPQYGLPVEWKEKNVPEVVLSGNHGKIEQWRSEQACKKTILKRFDWFRANWPSDEQVVLANQIIPPHYVAIMHTQINIKGGRVGESSIASLDIHDIARSAKTYGMKNYFIVSPLKDQQAIMRTFLKFWHSKDGKNYNESRYDAVELVIPSLNLDEVIATIREKEGKDPLLIATSAKTHGQAQVIDYYSQSCVWNYERPVLFVLGTGQGLADQVLEQSDFILLPVEGLTDYNHLSVRSAAAIIFDRWFGLQPKMRKMVNKC